MNNYHTAIIGAGPAGIMAAISSSQSGQRPILLERNNQLGKKLLLTGQGRCNLTTSKTVPEIVRAFGLKGKFLYSVLSKFSNQDLINFFESRGVELKEERGQRIFPQSNQAQIILNCLVNELDKLQLKIKYDFRVVKISRAENGFLIMSNQKQKLEAKKVILATGGKSYPETGSSGDGYLLAKSLGHTIEPLLPGLNGLIVGNKKLKSLAGLSLKNVRISFKTNGQQIISLFGDILFTHVGISGPIVLTASTQIAQLIHQGQTIKAQIDLKPALDKPQLKKRVFRDIHQIPKKEFQSLLNQLLPKSLVPYVIDQLKIKKQTLNTDLTSQQVDKLIDFLKDFSFPVKSVESLDRAIVTNGGIPISEIDSRTMGSRLVPGLYFGGEIISLPGPTGGFNLQKAFSTGYLAGLVN